MPFSRKPALTLQCFQRHCILGTLGLLIITILKRNERDYHEIERKCGNVRVTKTMCDFEVMVLGEWSIGGNFKNSHFSRFYLLLFILQLNYSFLCFLARSGLYVTRVQSVIDTTVSPPICNPLIADWKEKWH